MEVIISGLTAAYYIVWNKIKNITGWQDGSAGDRHILEKSGHLNLIEPMMEEKDRLPKIVL